MAVGKRKDPYRAYSFLLEIDGISRAGFSECSGLDVSADPIEDREGADPATVRKLPDLAKCANISLKRGITGDAQLWQWCKKRVDGQVERKNGSIIRLDDTGADKVRWNFREGWQTRWTGPSFNGTGNEVALESLDIAHEGLEKGLMVQTEFLFTLPIGYVDSEGNRHCDGVMRLATAYDELAPMKDPRVQANPGYLVVILLSRVITRLGEVTAINPRVIESRTLAISPTFRISILA